MDIEEFLKYCIEGYLFKDLENISKIHVTKGDVGEASFPMLSSILAGMELLGAIVNPKGAVTVTSGKREIDGGNQFDHYWIYYLSSLDKKYTGFNKLFYDLLRNGIVHTFMVKQHVIVYKTHHNHMSCSQDPPGLIIGCIELFRDFQQTYFNHVVPILKTEHSVTHVNRGTMQSNLDAILDLYSNEADTQFRNLQISKYTPVLNIPLTPTQGVSLSPYDIKDFVDYSGGTTTPSGINWQPKKKS